MTWIVKLDPIAAVGSRATLDLNSGPIQVQQAGIDWGDAAVQQYLAEQRFGQIPVSYRVPNRTVSLPLALGMGLDGEEEQARAQLQQKVALLQREGGVLLRQREGGPPLYADIVDAVLAVPDVWGETGEVEPGLTLRLVCLPDFYGEEVELDAVEEVGQAVGVLKSLGSPAAIAGDYPARCRIALEEKANQNQKALLWGFRSSHYSPDPTAALVYDARALTPLNGAVERSDSRCYSGHSVELEKPQPETWHPFLSTNLLAGAKPMSHLGTYRVFARVIAQAAAKFRLEWQVGDAVAAQVNAEQQVQAAGVSIVDLGTVHLGDVPVGERWWSGVIAVEAGPKTGQSAAVDRMWLQPVDDGCGRLKGTAHGTPDLLSPTKAAAAWESVAPGTAVWTPSGANGTRQTKNVTVAANSESQELKLTGFGFALPEGAVVVGIKAVFNSVSGTRLSYASEVVQMYKAAALAGTAKTAWWPDVSGGALVVGGSSDLWGTTWTPAQINAAGFGIGLKIVNHSGEPVTAAVIVVEVTVYYAFSASAVTQDAVLYADRETQLRTDGAFRESPATPSYAPVTECLGDLPRLPPSGLEGRLVELFVKNSRGEINDLDEGRDSIAAKVFYRPCYLGRI
jgi:hypothetical protein